MKKIIIITLLLTVLLAGCGSGPKTYTQGQLKSRSSQEDEGQDDILPDEYYGEGENEGGDFDDGNETKETEQVIYVDYPPELKLPCTACKDSGGIYFCETCGETGKIKLGEDSPAQVLPGGFVIPAMPAPAVNCTDCYGNGYRDCYTCWGNGEVRNPNYAQYVRDLKYLTLEYGTNIFEVNMAKMGYDSSDLYVAAIDCGICGMIGYYEGFLCPSCYGAGYWLYYPNSLSEDIDAMNQSSHMFNEVLRNNPYVPPEIDYMTGLNDHLSGVGGGDFQDELARNRNAGWNADNYGLLIEGTCGLCGAPIYSEVELLCVNCR